MSDEESGEDGGPQTLYALLSPPITSTISALGAPSPTDTSTYVLGDDALGCLKDLKRYWRRNDNDEERTVARILAKANVLEKDLVPILVQTAEKMPKVAIACADLITSMTWPLDLPSELQELDENGGLPAGSPLTDYPLLMRALLTYKAALANHPLAITSLVRVTLPALAAPLKSRTEREKQIVNVVLHAVRNILAIRDLRSDVNRSGDWGELASLQSTVIRRLKESKFLEVLSTLTSNADTPVANAYSSVLLEIWYLLYRGVPAAQLVIPSGQRPKEELQNMLSLETALKRGRTTATRHSRFGTAISVTTGKGKEKFVLHRQQGIGGLPGETIDAGKKAVAKKTKTTNELGLEQQLSHEALSILRELAITFLDACFNIFFASLLKDIRYERPHITEADNVRLLVVSSWFTSFFLAARARGDTDDAEKEKEEEEKEWSVSRVAECCEEEWIVWVVKRMRGAGEEKPKAWVELQACMEALTQLLLLIECMSTSPSEEIRDAAMALQHKLWFSSELMDVAFESAKSYSGQSLSYLDAVVHLNYVLLRLLEKYAKGRTSMFVRKRTNGKRKRKGKKDDDDVDNGADESEKEGPTYEQRKFEFEKYEGRFAHEDVTSTLLAYLARYRDLSPEGALGDEKVKRVVSLLHRQVVKAKAEGLFFKVSTLELFRHIMNDEKILPRDAPHKELVQLVQYTLRQFFKEVEKKPFLLVEAFFPKNRGMWKAYSSWQPTEKEKGVRASKDDDDEDDGPQEVQVKGKRSWSEQVGIAMACLVEDGKRDLVDWVNELLVLVIAERRAIIAMTDPLDEVLNLDDDVNDDGIRSRSKLPSAEAVAKFRDFTIPYDKEGRAEAATQNEHLKLMFTLVKFFVENNDADPLEWYCPPSIMPSELEGSLKVIDQFLEHPLDLEGKKASSLVRKKTKTRRRRPVMDDEDGVLSDDEGQRKRKEKKKKEKQQYKSAQFIQDSDVDADAEEEFFRKEAALREKAAQSAMQGGNTMRAGGMKKRKKRKQGDSTNKRRKTADGGHAADEADRASSDSDVDASEHRLSLGKTSTTPATTPPGRSVSSKDPVDAVEEYPKSTVPSTSRDDMDVGAVPEAPKRRPRPKPRIRNSAAAAAVSTSTPVSPQLDMPMPDGEDDEEMSLPLLPRGRGRYIVSDEDD